jgi:hypothetical protein
MRGNNDHPSHCQRIAVTADTPTCDGSRDLVTDLRSITQVTRPSGGDPPSLPVHAGIAARAQDLVFGADRWSDH